MTPQRGRCRTASPVPRVRHASESASRPARPALLAAWAATCPVTEGASPHNHQMPADRMAHHPVGTKSGLSASRPCARLISRTDTGSRDRLSRAMEAGAAYRRYRWVMVSGWPYTDSADASRDLERGAANANRECLRRAGDPQACNLWIRLRNRGSQGNEKAPPGLGRGLRPGALGGTRTPNLLIRRSVRGVQRVRWHLYPQIKVHCWSGQ